MKSRTLHSKVTTFTKVSVFSVLLVGRTEHLQSLQLPSDIFV